MNKDLLLKAYEIIVEEEKFYVESHQKRIQFFTTFISALFVATITAILKVTSWSQLLFVNFGPILIIVLSSTGIKATQRLWNVILAANSSRLKIEQELGFLNTRTLDSQFGEWGKESIMTPSRLVSESKSKSSEEFISTMKPIGYHKIIRNLFIVFQVLSVLLIVGILCLSASNFN